jgi:hypothetical protein
MANALGRAVRARPGSKREKEKFEQKGPVQISLFTFFF